MKNNNIIIAGLCAAALLSCNKEKPAEDTTPGPMTFSVVSEIPGDGSKAYLDGLHVNFRVGDAISVFDGTANNEFTAQSETTFSGSAIRGRESYLIVSPYRDNYTMIDDNTVEYEIPDVQVATLGTFDPAAFVSVGKLLKTGGPVHLYSAVSLVEVTVPSGLEVREIQISDANVGQAIAGRYRFKASDKSITHVEGRYLITLVPQPGGTTIAPGTYYIVVRPKADYPGLTLAYVDGSDQLCKRRSTTNPTVIMRNHILPLGTITPSKHTAVTGKAVLKPAAADGTESSTVLIKQLANSGVTARDAIDNSITRIVFKAHSLIPYSATKVLSTDGSSLPIKAVKYGSTVYVYTEAPTITLYGDRCYDQFYNFYALESVEINSITSESNALMSFFHSCKALKSVKFGKADFSQVINMNQFFQPIENEQYRIESIDLGDMTTTTNTKMIGMFKDSGYLRELKLGPDFVLGTERTDMFLNTAYQTSSAGGKCDIYLSDAVYLQLTQNADASSVDPVTKFNKARFTRK